ncbi:MAG: patatin-like phospholipase family protein [Defluviitaleaceae bacterium]|nr:patatin-like phospholipase family protein [Defluviitaleaceae bacterium]
MDIQPNIGLVLSGGFAKGAYQIGVFKAIGDFFGDTQIKYISASSVGVLNAYAFLQKKMGVTEQAWRGLKFASFSSFTKAYFRSSFIPEFVGKISQDATPCPAGFYGTFLNINKRRLNYIHLSRVEQSHVPDFLLASVTLPVFSRAVEISGTKYVDGALVDNIPVKPLTKLPIDYAIVVHFDNDNYTFENETFDSKLIKINFLDEGIIKSSLSFNPEAIDRMIKAGYDASIAIFEKVFDRGFSDTQYIHHKIKLLHQGREKKSFRLTGDVAVNNMNKVLKKIIK